MRVSNKKLHASLYQELADSFTQLIIDLKNVDETKKFLGDFFNKNEIQTFIKRLSVAYWLKKGRSYQNIKENLKVSSATIASIQKIMDREGIKIAIKKMEADEWANQWSEKIKKMVR
ncbi:MAG: YerC/YecD family TrpR-related protein [Patescibacteria group bacterium]